MGSSRLPGGGVSQAGSGCDGDGDEAVIDASTLGVRRNADVPRDRSWPTATASTSAETRLCPSRCSVRTFNRNFPGRQGSTKSETYLCNPVIAAASAVKGVIASPDEL